jgi:hypothetical protein
MHASNWGEGAAGRLLLRLFDLRSDIVQHQRAQPLTVLHCIGHRDDAAHPTRPMYVSASSAARRSVPTCGRRWRGWAVRPWPCGVPTAMCCRRRRRGAWWKHCQRVNYCRSLASGMRRAWLNRPRSPVSNAFSVASLRRRAASNLPRRGGDRRRSADRPDRRSMVARADHGMIRP